MSDSTLHLEIDREDHARTRLREEPRRALEAGQVRFRIERFAVTANNVTYAAFGDALGYWGFFPTEPGFGRVPAVGYAEIVESAHPEVPTGGRYHGWFPMSQQVVMTVSPHADGVRDEGAHREPHAAIYRGYTNVAHDPFHEPGEDAEDRSALLRVLFLTGFLADDFFAEHDYHGASRVIVLSASSKTAIGFAKCAAARGAVEVFGLTSPAHAEFVSGLGCYDRVVPYGELETVPTDGDAVAIDMAGNGEVLARVHDHFGERLRHSMMVGRSHHDAPQSPPSLKGPQPELFFAPFQVAKRVEEWGRAGYQERIAKALHAFIDASRGWLEIERTRGPEAAESTWQAVRTGSVPPHVGRIASLWA